MQEEAQGHVTVKPDSAESLTKRKGVLAIAGWIPFFLLLSDDFASEIDFISARVTADQSFFLSVCLPWCLRSFLRFSFILSRLTYVQIVFSTSPCQTLLQQLMS